jgi:hypothetical protein
VIASEPSRVEAGSDAVGHVATLQPSGAGRKDPEPWDTGYVTALKPSLAGKHDHETRDSGRALLSRRQDLES